MSEIAERLREKWAKFSGDSLDLFDKIIKLDSENNSQTSKSENIELEDGEIVDVENDKYENIENVIGNSSLTSIINSEQEKQPEFGVFDGVDDENCNINKSKFLCRFFREGFCKHGSLCRYSHNTVDSHRQPILCSFYANGNCFKREKCDLLHAEYPCIDFHRGSCRASFCRFSHQPLNDFTQVIYDKATKPKSLFLISTCRPSLLGTPDSPRRSIRKSDRFCPYKHETNSIQQ